MTIRAIKVCGLPQNRFG